MTNLETKQTREEFIRHIEEHMKQASRKLLKINSRDEIMTVLGESFKELLKCDFVGIGLNLNGYLRLHYLSGDIDIEKIFPYPTDKVNPVLYERSIKSDDNYLDPDSILIQYFKKSGIDSWFTVPIAEDHSDLGLIIVGYYDNRPFFNEMRELFKELGAYAAIAMKMIQRNESSQRQILYFAQASHQLMMQNSIEDLLEKVVTLSGRESRSHYTGVYLLDQAHEALLLQKPTFGYVTLDDYIPLSKGNLLKDYLPRVEQIGYSQITIPLIINEQMVGAMVCEKPAEQIFSGKDFELLQTYANYFSAMYENLSLRRQEKIRRQELEELFNLQNNLIKSSLEQTDIDKMNQLLGEFVERDIIVFDQFLNPYSKYLQKDSSLERDILMKEIKNYKLKHVHLASEFRLSVQDTEMVFRRIEGDREALGFIAYSEKNVNLNKETFNLAISMALNIYATFFMKYKIERDALNQLKNSFVGTLFSGKPHEELNQIITYASYFNFDIDGSYEVALLAIEDVVPQSDDLVVRRIARNTVMNELIYHLSKFDSKLVTAIYKGRIVLLKARQGEEPGIYWQKLFKTIRKAVNPQIGLWIGIGGQVLELKDYRDRYDKAKHVLNVIQRTGHEPNFASYDELGSYVILNELNQIDETKLFVKSQLGKLWDASIDSSMDLFETLRVYLNNHCSVKASADELFLHRSTMNYRLEKIKEILEIELDDNKHQFNLLLAYHLFDLFGEKLFE